MVGESRHTWQAGIDLAHQDLGDEGFLIQTIGESLIIAGGRRRGTLYGVYTFLEDYLGCRWFSPKVSRIPQAPVIEIGPIERRDKPILEWREPRCGDIEQDGDWAAAQQGLWALSPYRGATRRRVAVGALRPYVFTPCSRPRPISRNTPNGIPRSTASAPTTAPSCASPTRR